LIRSVAFILPVLLLLGAGCTGIQDTAENPSFTLSDDGILSLQVPPVPSATIRISVFGNVTVEEVNFMTGSGNVSSVLVTPPQPVAGIVWAPGAGVPASGHINHLVQYGDAGYAVPSPGSPV
jgi:hypothetical protein